MARFQVTFVDGKGEITRLQYENKAAHYSIEGGVLSVYSGRGKGRRQYSPSYWRSVDEPDMDYSGERAPDQFEESQQ